MYLQRQTINYQMHEIRSCPTQLIKLNKLIECLTSNPAKILKINKGSLSVGSDADLCIVDIYKPWVVKREQIQSKSKNTAIEDKKLQGKVEKTFLNGKLVFEL